MKKVQNDSKKNMIDPQQKRIIIGAVAGIAILLMVVLMFIENAQGKIVISNHTNTNLEYVKVYFVGAEGPLHEGYDVQDLEVGKSQRYPVGENKLLGAEANLEVRFKFEGAEEVFVDAGYFNDTFAGNISVDFSSTEDADIARLHVKASNGLLKSNLIDCDDEFFINITEGYEVE
ncbi:MAG: hypothetical protein GX359_04060 [Clostridiales bacterium]|nr:hypothetical protein [Clostridiales bacterium]